MGYFWTPASPAASGSRYVKPAKPLKVSGMAVMTQQPLQKELSKNCSEDLLYATDAIRIPIGVWQQMHQAGKAVHRRQACKRLPCLHVHSRGCTALTVQVQMRHA